MQNIFRVKTVVNESMNFRAVFVTLVSCKLQALFCNRVAASSVFFSDMPGLMNETGDVRMFLLHKNLLWLPKRL